LKLISRPFISRTSYTRRR